MTGCKVYLVITNLETNEWKNCENNLSVPTLYPSITDSDRMANIDSLLFEYMKATTFDIKINCIIATLSAENYSIIKILMQFHFIIMNFMICLKEIHI